MPHPGEASVMVLTEGARPAAQWRLGQRSLKALLERGHPVIVACAHCSAPVMDCACWRDRLFASLLEKAKAEAQAGLGAILRYVNQPGAAPLEQEECTALVAITNLLHGAEAATKLAEQFERQFGPKDEAKRP
jgi:hypothetical protein